MKKFLLTLAALMAATCSIEAASESQRAAFERATSPYQQAPTPAVTPTPRIATTTTAGARAASATSPFAARRAQQVAQVAQTASAYTPTPSITPPSIVPQSIAPAPIAPEIAETGRNVVSGFGANLPRGGATPPVAPITVEQVPAQPRWWQRWPSWLGGTETAAPTITTEAAATTAPTEGGFRKYLPTRESLSKYIPTRESLSEYIPTREGLTERLEKVKTGITGSVAELQTTAAEAAKPIAEAYQEGFGPACKAAGGQFRSSVEYRPKTYAAIGLGGALAVGGLIWYRWYNQQEKQILRAATSGNISETERLLNQLVANVNAAAGTPDFAKKQVAALNIFRDIFTQVEKEKPARTLIIDWDGLYAKVNEIGGPYYIAWTLAELEPVTKHLFKHTVKADADFINFIQEAALTTGNTPDEIHDIILAAIINATDKANATIRAQNADNTTRANAIIGTKFAHARQAANTITNAQTKQAVLAMLNELQGAKTAYASPGTYKVVYPGEAEYPEEKPGQVIPGHIVHY